jgi:tripartite-type tricarboxylate transporter receptor subunit TctC
MAIEEVTGEAVTGEAVTGKAVTGKAVTGKAAMRRVGLLAPVFVTVPSVTALSVTALSVTFLLAAASPSIAAEPPYPRRPISLIVPFPPGAATDAFARVVARNMVDVLGQQVVVINRDGASGIIGTDAVARAAPDGYTLVWGTSSGLSILPALKQKLPFDPQRDLAPISLGAKLAYVLVVHPSVPAANVKQLVAIARAQPGKLNYASAGTGGAPHMAGELFKSVTGANVTHVPYKGSGPAVADLIGGRVQVMFDAAPSLIAHVRAGKLRVLAAASPQRNRLLPDIPTFSELGISRVEVSLWYGLLAPAGTPRPVVERLNREVSRVLEMAEIRDRLQAQGAEPMPGSPDAFAAFMRAEMQKWAPVVKQAGVKLD